MIRDYFSPFLVQAIPESIPLLKNKYEMLKQFDQSVVFKKIQAS